MVEYYVPYNQTERGSVGQVTVKLDVTDCTGVVVYSRRLKIVM